MANSKLPAWVDLDRLAACRPAEGWERNGTCYETGDTDRFYQEGPVPEAIAELCAACPARYACLKTAANLSESLDHGIWGGTSKRQRRTVRALLARRAA